MCIRDRVKSYWEANTNTDLKLEKLTKDTKSEIVVIGGGYTGLLCAINLIEKYLSLIHISEPTRRRGISYAVFCLKKKIIVMNWMKNIFHCYGKRINEQFIS